MNAMGEIEGVLDEEEEEQQQAPEQEEGQDAWAQVAEMREHEESQEQAQEQTHPDQQYPDFQ